MIAKQPFHTKGQQNFLKLKNPYSHIEEFTVTAAHRTLSSDKNGYSLAEINSQGVISCSVWLIWLLVEEPLGQSIIQMYE